MESISELIGKARAAQAEFEKTATQESVDAIVKAIAKVIYDNADPLAKMAAEESGMGVYEDKINKNKGKARVIWNFLKDKKSSESSIETRKPVLQRSHVRWVSLRRLLLVPIRS